VNPWDGLEDIFTGAGSIFLCSLAGSSGRVLESVVCAVRLCKLNPMCLLLEDHHSRGAEPGTAQLAHLVLIIHERLSEIRFRQSSKEQANATTSEDDDVLQGS
jgi:hypothetical protein